MGGFGEEGVEALGAFGGVGADVAFLLEVDEVGVAVFPLVVGEAEVAEASGGEGGEVGEAVAAEGLGEVLAVVLLDGHELPPVVGVGGEGAEDGVEALEVFVVGFGLGAVGIREELAEGPVVGGEGVHVGLLEAQELLAAAVEALFDVVPAVGGAVVGVPMEGGFVVGDGEEPEAVEPLGEGQGVPHLGFGVGEVADPLAAAREEVVAQLWVVGCVGDEVAVHAVAEQGVGGLETYGEEVVEAFVALVFGIGVGLHEGGEDAGHAVEDFEPDGFVVEGGGFVILLFGLGIEQACTVVLVGDVLLHAQDGPQGAEGIGGVGGEMEDVVFHGVKGGSLRFNEIRDIGS